MAKTEPLLELIQSLTAAEKRYFRRYTNRASGKDDTLYMLLFDHIDKTQSGELAGMKKGKLTDKLAANFSYHKNYLYKQILKALQAYHLSSDQRVQFYEALTEIHLLLNKGLVEQAEKRIRAAKKLAVRYHFEIGMTQLLALERNIIRSHASKDSFAKLELVQAEADTQLEQLRNRFLVTDLYDKIYLLARNRSLQGLDADSVLGEARQREAELGTLAFSFEGRFAYHLLFFLYYQQFTDNLVRAGQHLRAIIDLYHADPQLQQEHTLRYVHLLNSYFNNLLLQSDFQDFEPLLERLDALDPKTDALQLKIRYLRIHMILLKKIHERDLNGIRELLAELKEALEVFENQIPQNDLLMLKQGVALGYFVIGDYSTTLEWTNYLLNESKQEIRQDARLLCRQLELLIFYDRDDCSLVESIARSIIRQTNKAEDHEPWGQCAHLLARTILKATTVTPTQVPSLFKNAISALAAFRTYVNGKQELMGWLEERS